MTHFSYHFPHDTLKSSSAGLAADLADENALDKKSPQGVKVAGRTIKGKKARPEQQIVSVHCVGLQHELSIPYAQLTLSNGDKLLRYSVDLEPDVLQRKPLRAAWHTEGEFKTQLEYARAGVITPEMEYVALRESACFAECFAEHRDGSHSLAVGADIYGSALTNAHKLGDAVKGIEQTAELAEAAKVTESAGAAEATEGETSQVTQAHKPRPLFTDKSLASFAEFKSGKVEFDLNKLPVTPEFVRSEIAAGRAVIPCSRNHPESEPMIIGRKFLTKVNANIGASAVSSGYEEEIAKLKLSLRYGADTVMDLSTGIEDLGSLRQAIIRSSPVPIGTVPIYETLDRVKGSAEALNWEVFKQVIIDQCEQGVDYFTIHAGLTRDLLPLAAKRLMGIVSRGGAIMASQMLSSGAENMAYEHFDELMEICKRYDVALSLGDGLRPGAIYDACDEAQYGELKNLGQLAARCFENGVQCFIEGPGHVPLHKVEENQRLEDELCHEAPFYTLGPLVTDAGAGFDHITSAIGGTTIGMHGTAMLCYVTPAEHLALPTSEDVKQGLITYKIAAHSADLAKGLLQAYNLDHAMSRARAEFRWFDQFALSFDPEHAYQVWKSPLSEGDEECTHEVAFCSMCGPRFCPIRLNRRLKSKFS